MIWNMEWSPFLTHKCLPFMNSGGFSFRVRKHFLEMNVYENCILSFISLDTVTACNSPNQKRGTRTNSIVRSQSFVGIYENI